MIPMTISLSSLGPPSGSFSPTDISTALITTSIRSYAGISIQKVALTLGSFVTRSVVGLYFPSVGAFFAGIAAVTTNSTGEATGSLCRFVADGSVITATAVGEIGREESQGGKEETEDCSPCKSHGLGGNIRSMNILISVMADFLTFTPTRANRPSRLKAFCAIT